MKKKCFEGLDTAPSKSYATPFMIACVAFYFAFITAAMIWGLLNWWPKCEIPNSASSNADQLTVTSVTPGFGRIKGDERVSIRGTGFTDNAAVSFGNKQGQGVTIADSTHLSVSTPAGKEGIVDIVVTTNPNGSPAGKRWGGLARGFLYINSNAPPKPSINSLKPASGPLIGGQPVTIKGAGFDNTTMVSFGGLPGTNIQVFNDTTLVVTTPSNGEGKVDVVVEAGDIDILTDGYTYTCWDIMPTQLFLMIILASALGGCVHGLRSLVWHVGDRNLEKSRLLKYYLLPLIGSAIGVIFFLAVSAGLYKVQDAGNMILIGLSGLVGMFSDQAAEKLKKIAEGLLNEAPKAGKNTPITVASITPDSGGGGTQVIILGEDFDEPPIVRFGNNEATVKKCSLTAITVIAPENPIGKVDVFVINKNGQSFTVRDGFTYEK